MLPNGRNICGLSQDDLFFIKYGKNRQGVNKQIALSKQNTEQFKITLDKWRQSAQTHKSGTALTLKLGNNR